MEMSDQVHSPTALFPVPIWFQDILSQFPLGVTKRLCHFRMRRKRFRHLNKFITVSNDLSTEKLHVLTT